MVSLAVLCCPKDYERDKDDQGLFLLSSTGQIENFLRSIRQYNPLFVGCGGSLVVHQTVKPAVPGSNPASLQSAVTCHSLLGSQQGWHETAGWPLGGGRGNKIEKVKKNNYKKKKESRALRSLIYEEEKTRKSHATVPLRMDPILNI